MKYVKYLLLFLCACIPLIGVGVGIALIVIGLKKDKILLAIGFFGVTFSIVIYSTLYQMMDVTKLSAPKSNKIKVNLVRVVIKQNTYDLHQFKARFNRYPDSLSELNQVNKKADFRDPLYTFYKMGDKTTENLIYIKTEDYFKLFSAGFDRKVGTADDIY